MPIYQGEKQSTKAGWSRCLGSTPWANLGSIDEVAEVKLNLIKVACIPPTRKGRQIRDSPEKKNSLHTRQFIAPPCAIKGEKQFFGGKVRPHSVGCQFSSTRMISDVLEIKIYSNIWFNSNWCQFIKVRSNPLKAGRSRCPGSAPWANLGSIDEVAEVKLLILKICGLDIYGLVWKCTPLCEFLCLVVLGDLIWLYGRCMR